MYTLKGFGQEELSKPTESMETTADVTTGDQTISVTGTTDAASVGVTKPTDSVPLSKPQPWYKTPLFYGIVAIAGVSLAVYAMRR